MSGKKAQVIDVVVALVILVVAACLVAFFFIGSPSLTSAGEVMTFRSVDRPIYPGTVKLMTYNIHYGSGYTNDYIKDAQGDQVFRYLDDVASLIGDADIVALQEVDRHVKRSHFEDEVSYLARKGNFSHAVFSDSWNVKLPFLPPVKFGRLRTGHAILSKYPITFHDSTIFEKPSSSVWHRLFFVWRTLQFADIDVFGTRLRVFNVHLESESKVDRMDQAVQLRSFAESSPHPLVLMGDFNALMPEASEKVFEGEDYVDDSTIATVRASGLREIFPPEQYTKDESRYFTFPSREPDRRLDYIFVSEDIDVASAYLLDDDKAREASDHLPHVISIRFRGGQD